MGVKPRVRAAKRFEFAVAGLVAHVVVRVDIASAARAGVIDDESPLAIFPEAWLVDLYHNGSRIIDGILVDPEARTDESWRPIEPVANDIQSIEFPFYLSHQQFGVFLTRGELKWPVDIENVEDIGCYPTLHTMLGDLFLYHSGNRSLIDDLDSDYEAALSLRKRRPSLFAASCACVPSRRR